MEINIIHEKKYQQFTVVLGEEEAELAYSLPAAGMLDFTHTYVPESARGKGIAQKLIEEGLRYARQNGYKIQASCPVVKKYLQTHPEQMTD